MENCSRVRNVPVFTTTSPENPLLAINAQEYLTLKRYQNDRKMPERFRSLPGQSTAHEQSLYAPREEKKSPNPMFKTSYSELGQFKPNKHTMPHSYHGLSSRFTAKITQHGMYRNHSVNL